MRRGTEARSELTLEHPAETLGTSKMTVLRIVGTGSSPTTQTCKGAPGSSRPLMFGV